MNRPFAPPAESSEIRALPEGDIATWLRGLGVNFVTGVPDSEFKEFIAELEGSSDPDIYRVGTREDNAVALASGGRLAGTGVPLVFMESSGIGNAIDSLTSLAQVYELPMVLYIAWAGYKGRDVPHHNVIGRPLEHLLHELSIPIVHCVLDKRIRNLEKAIITARQLALASSQPVALLGAPEEV
jgi:phosphonopyruvate decarboxylase